MKCNLSGIGRIAISSLALFACGSSDGGGGGGGGDDAGPGGGGGGGWHAITFPSGQSNNSVMGVYCTSPIRCVITTTFTGNGADAGGVFAVDDKAVGAELVDGNSAQLMDAADAHVIGGGLDFVGLSPVGNKLMARMAVSGAFVTAPLSDITSSWSFVSMGTSDGSTLGLNPQNVLQSDAAGQTWLFINKMGGVFRASQAPGTATVWTETWNPTATTPVPADFEEQLAASIAADPAHPLCDSDVSAGGNPPPGNPNWVAPDLSVILLPAGGLNETGDAAPGICVSTDKGDHFYNIALAGLPTDSSVVHPGPTDVTCLDRDHCFAFSGLPFEKGTAYIYTTTNASQGKAATWTAATVPASWASSDMVELHGMFFAPDGQHGWVAGNTDHHPLLARTTDGGAHWTDVSTSLGNTAMSDLYSGFALDADHVWLAGRFGTLVATATAQK